MMWTTRTIAEANDRIIKLTIAQEENELTYADVIRLWSDSEQFRRFIITKLTVMPFAAFRWEIPPVTKETLHRPFECAVIDSPGLEGPSDSSAFASYFHTHAKDGIAVFSNLGKDAVLVVPCPVSASSEYGHFAAFLRSAPLSQQHALWSSIAQAMNARLGNAPIWLNTAGAGVPWLHVRLDSRPKYYRYEPYKIYNA